MTKLFSANRSRSTLRYAAKQAYQLMLMRGIYESHVVGLYALVKPSEGIVALYDANDDSWHNVPIAKAWANL